MGYASNRIIKNTMIMRVVMIAGDGTAVRHALRLVRATAQSSVFRGSGRRQSQKAMPASRTPTMMAGRLKPRQSTNTPQPTAIPKAASRLPRALTRRPSSQSRNARPNRGWASSLARHFGEPLPSAHAPTNRNTVVGMSGMKALMMPMPTLVKPSRRQRNNGMTATGYRKRRFSGVKLRSEAHLQPRGPHR